MSEPSPATERPPWFLDLHILIPNASGTAILMLPSAEGWCLPRVRGDDMWLSEAKKIIPLLRATFSLNFDFTILRYASIDTNMDERWDRLILVIEPAHPLTDPPLNGQWVDRATLQTIDLALPEQRAPLLHYLAENTDAQLIDLRRSPWARPGWFATAAAWIAAALTELGYVQSGSVEQFRNWSISSILATPTTTGRVYFKAAAALPFFVNEPALTATLAELAPAHLPTPLKVDLEQRWMLMQDFGPPAWDDDDIDLAPIFRAYGELQRTSAAHLDQLTAAGCIDRRLTVLATHVDWLFTDPTTASAITPAEFDELTTLGPRLKARCAEVAAYNLPATLIHGDLHLGNITQRDGHYIFFDWTDAAISFPFFDHFLLYFETEATPARLHQRDAYLETWQAYASPARLLELWEHAKPLCALHHAISYLTILNHIEPLTRAELSHGLTDNLQRLLAALRAETQ